MIANEKNVKIESKPTSRRRVLRSNKQRCSPKKNSPEKNEPKMRSLRIVVEKLDKNTIDALLNGTERQCTLTSADTLPKTSPKTSSMDVTSSDLQQIFPHSCDNKRQDQLVVSQPVKKRRLDIETRQLRSQNSIENKGIDDRSKKTVLTKQKSQSQLKHRRSRKVVMTVISMPPALDKYELVWARVRGFPFWPGIIEEETKRGKYNIHFFGDYSKSEVTKSRILHFFEGFRSYSEHERPTKQLHRAVEEAKYLLFMENRSNSCFICDMLANKRNLYGNSTHQICENQGDSSNS